MLIRYSRKMCAISQKRCDMAHEMHPAALLVSLKVTSMKYLQLTTSILVLAIGAGACGESPAAPRRAVPSQSLQAASKGTGLVLNSLTSVSVPLIGHLGDVTIDQVQITNFTLLENAVGAIVGLQVDGVLQLSGDVLGTPVVTEDFTTWASITSSGPGQCSLVTIDLNLISIDALGVVSVDLPVARLTGKGSGVVGTLLCNLGSMLSGLLSGGVGSPGAQGVVNALNNQIG